MGRIIVAGLNLSKYLKPMTAVRLIMKLYAVVFKVKRDAAFG